VSNNKCFVMMPFNDHFQSYYERVFSPAIQNVGLSPIKVDEVYTPTQISDDIFELIQNATIILADVTTKNPNVNYELGIAHALDKKTVIITQDRSDIPFDYQHLRHILYDTKFAGWEEKLREQIESSILSVLRMNTPTTSITGKELNDLFSFLENTALDASYEISKTFNIKSDLSGNCQVRQSWTIKAKSDVTHLIHGVICDEPGTIKLHNVYDKTNGTTLNTLISLGNEKRARYIIFLSKLLKSGESISFDLDFSADGYLAHLFSERKRITIFQKVNTRRNVFYKFRKDTYEFPATDFTRNLLVKCDGSTSEEDIEIKEVNGKIIVNVDLFWSEPYSGGYSYDIYSV